MCGSRIGVDKIGVGVGGIIGAFHITIAQGLLDGGERRNGSTVAFQLGLTFLVGSFDSRFDLCDRLGVGLGNDQTDNELRGIAVN